MVGIEESIEVAAPVARAFAYVADHRHALDWMVGFSEFTPVGEVATGLGAKVLAAGRLLGIRVATTLEIVEFVEGERLVSVSDGPVRSRTAWEFAPTEAGTRVTFRGEYQLEGLPVPALGDALLRHEVRERTALSLRRLKRALEGPGADAGGPPE